MGKKNYCSAVVFCSTLFLTCIYAANLFSDHTVHFRRGEKDRDKTIGIQQLYHPGARYARNHHFQEHHLMHKDRHNFIRQLHRSSDMTNRMSNKAQGRRSESTLFRNDYTLTKIRRKPRLERKRNNFKFQNSEKQVRTKSGLGLRRTFNHESAKTQIRSKPSLEFRRHNFNFDSAEKQVRSVHDVPIQPTISELENVTEIESSLEEPMKICFSKTTILMIIVGASLFVIVLVVIFAVTCSWIIMSRFWKNGKQEKNNFAADKWWSNPSSSGLLGFFSRIKRKEIDDESSIFDESSVTQSSRYTTVTL